MKTFKHASIAAAVLAAASFSQTASAAWTANLGLMSDYHFRGVQQAESASAMGGVDYENEGFYFGTWAAEVEDGLEVDIYGGYGLELESGVGLGIGYTTYQYTGDFDSAYNEVNLSASYGMLSVGYSIGSWDGVVGNEAATESDYTFLEVTLSHNGFYGTFGSWGDEFEGEYGEIGYGTDVAGFDVGVALVVSGNDLDNSESLYFSISKTFDL
ncbi:TorF family putative porin [Aestuariibacter salexigens]|uniref:TorF family putative porin n=1 Tax=Aestuariibacter salexigens TaxID=226010 RepID=UPI0004142D05|nr:TorF family putative porin [Aestuariibacter salexigens]